MVELRSIILFSFLATFHDEITLPTWLQRIFLTHVKNKSSRHERMQNEFWNKKITVMVQRILETNRREEIKQAFV